MFGAFLIIAVAGSMYANGHLPPGFLFLAVTGVWLISSAPFFRGLWGIPNVREVPIAVTPVLWKPLPRPQFRYKGLDFRSLSVIFALIGAVGWIYFGALPELERLRGWAPFGITRSVVVAAFVLYLLFHAVPAIRFVRRLSWEWKLIRSGEVSVGRIFEQSPSNQGWGDISYEFSDARGNQWKGQGVDPTRMLYENMEVAVLFNPEAPEQNTALIGLTFHRSV
jgi:hypothetical protein